MNSSSSILDCNAVVYPPGMNYDYARAMSTMAFGAQQQQASALPGNDQSTDGVTESAYVRLAQAVHLNNVAAEAMHVEPKAEGGAGDDSSSPSSSYSSATSNNVSVPAPAEAVRALELALESLAGISSAAASTCGA